MFIQQTQAYFLSLNMVLELFLLWIVQRETQNLSFSNHLHAQQRVFYILKCHRSIRLFCSIQRHVPRTSASSINTPNAKTLQPISEALRDSRWGSDAHADDHLAAKMKRNSLNTYVLQSWSLLINLTISIGKDVTLSTLSLKIKHCPIEFDVGAI